MMTETNLALESTAGGWLARRKYCSINPVCPLFYFIIFYKELRLTLSCWTTSTFLLFIFI